jgi:hypothetical protein
VLRRGEVQTRVLMGKPKLERPLGRHRSRCEDYITMDLPDVRWEACTGLIWLRIRTDDWHW